MLGAAVTGAASFPPLDVPVPEPVLEPEPELASPEPDTLLLPDEESGAPDQEESASDTLSLSGCGSSSLRMRRRDWSRGSENIKTSTHGQEKKPSSTGVAAVKGDNIERRRCHVVDSGLELRAYVRVVVPPVTAVVVAVAAAAAVAPVATPLGSTTLGGWHLGTQLGTFNGLAFTVKRPCRGAQRQEDTNHQILRAKPSGKSEQRQS